MKVSELMEISDILDKREEELCKREKILEDKQNTLKSAYKEFKFLLEKLEKYYE